VRRFVFGESRRLEVGGGVGLRRGVVALQSTLEGAASAGTSARLSLLGGTRCCKSRTVASDILVVVLGSLLVPQSPKQ